MLTLQALMVDSLDRMPVQVRQLSHMNRPGAIQSLISPKLGGNGQPTLDAIAHLEPAQ
ncbi:hypothetical protein [Azonexus sp.]|uniref:hypothetical protein n=1 Tax=Azonexus sp. TaxID=1872668 RepID=UPI0035A10740